MKFKLIETTLADIRSAPREVRHLAGLVFLIGVHSIILGIFIFFFTESFYRQFFFAEIQNFFFVRQAGLLLFCLGLFNMAVLMDMRKRSDLVMIIIATKVLAFLFLISHAHLTAWPPIIYLAALGDGLMAVLLFFFNRRAGLVVSHD